MNMQPLISREDARAIVRMIALALSKSTMEAEVLADWAYERVENRRTDDTYASSIIERFLATDKPVTRSIKNEFLERFIAFDGGFPVEEAKSIILRMPYNEFLKTPYWKTIAEAVKDRDGNKCQRCGAEKRLHVHHLNYQHHGDELNHFDDLVTLCRNCHKEVHDEKRAHKTV